MNENLARDFKKELSKREKELARREIENVTKDRFEELKKLALEMFDQNCALQEIAEKAMKESLVGIDFSNFGSFMSVVVFVKDGKQYSVRYIYDISIKEWVTDDPNSEFNSYTFPGLKGLPSTVEL
jgi:hypothetical protein